MPVSSVAQRQDIQIRTFNNVDSDKSSAFADTLLKQQTFVDKESTAFKLASSAYASESSGNKYIKASQPASQPLLSSQVVYGYQDLQTKSQSIDQQTPSKSIPVEKRESRTVRIQNYLKGMLKDNTANIPLGTLNKANPTVSHVVRNNENIKGYHWEIIHAEINKNKPYSTVSQGTNVSVNPNTLELFFDKPQNLIEKENPVPEKLPPIQSSQSISKIEELKSTLQELTANNDEPVILGSLSKKMSTVSQVINNNEYTKDLYKEIIYSEINSSKPYNRLQPGTKICINPATLELIIEEPLTDKARKGEQAEACLDKPCSGLSKNERLHQYVAGLEPDSNKLIKIGVLGKEHSSISEVLNSDERFEGFHWGIILSDINRDKPFNTLAPGTEVSLNPANLELLFNVKDSVNAAVSSDKKDQSQVYKETAIPSTPAAVESAKIEDDKLKNDYISPSKPESIIEKPVQPSDQAAIPSITKIEEQEKNQTAVDTKKPTVNQQTSHLNQYVSNIQADKSNLIKIGSLSEKLPTVSQLLKNDPRFDGYHWDIILSDINSNKQFNTLSAGTEVSIDPETLELLFNVSDSTLKTSPAPISYEETLPPKSTNAATLQSSKPEPIIRESESIYRQDSAGSNIGLVEKENEKITALLKSQSTALYQKVQKEAEPVKFTEQLASSSKQMIGKFSNEVDNYKLLLNGLESQGIRYEGKGGLKENLSQLATLMWLDESALQSVDGILKIAGETVFSKTIPNSATKEQLQNFTKKMAYYLEKGLVATMATPTMKQSGIVSGHKDSWTLINSNTMTNGNDSISTIKKIDEVALDQRIVSLQSKAAENGERLAVTLSFLEENILRNSDKLVELKKKKMGLFSKFPKARMTP